MEAGQSSILLPLPKGDEGGFLNLFVELTNALNPHCSAHLHLLPSH